MCFVFALCCFTAIREALCLLLQIRLQISLAIGFWGDLFVKFDSIFCTFMLFAGNISCVQDRPYKCQSLQISYFLLKHYVLTPHLIGGLVR